MSKPISDATRAKLAESAREGWVKRRARMGLKPKPRRVEKPLHPCACGCGTLVRGTYVNSAHYHKVHRDGARWTTPEQAEREAAAACTVYCRRYSWFKRSTAGEAASDFRGHVCDPVRTLVPRGLAK